MSIVIPQRQVKPKLPPTQGRVVPKPLQAVNTDRDNFPTQAAPVTVKPRGLFLPFNYFPRAYLVRKKYLQPPAPRDRRALSCRDKPVPSPRVVPCVGSRRRAHLRPGNVVSCPSLSPLHRAVTGAEANTAPSILPRVLMRDSGLKWALELHSSRGKKKTNPQKLKKKKKKCI